MLTPTRRGLRKTTIARVAPILGWYQTRGVAALILAELDDLTHRAKGKHDRGPGGAQGHKCTTRRCQLKRDKLESAKAEEDFGWKQKVPYRARDG